MFGGDFADMSSDKFLLIYIHRARAVMSSMHRYGERGSPSYWVGMQHEQKPFSSMLNQKTGNRFHPKLYTMKSPARHKQTVFNFPALNSSLHRSYTVRPEMRRNCHFQLSWLSISSFKTVLVASQRPLGLFEF